MNWTNLGKTPAYQLKATMLLMRTVKEGEKECVYVLVREWKPMGGKEKGLRRKIYC